MRAVSVFDIVLNPDIWAMFCNSWCLFFPCRTFQALSTLNTSALRRGLISLNAFGSLTSRNRSASEENLPCEGNCFKLMLMASTTH
eukprot:10572_4